jgi:hypothetical protein
MVTKKISLANIKGKLSRAEMKNIMAGSGNIYCSSKKCGTTVNGHACEGDTTCKCQIATTNCIAK